MKLVIQLALISLTVASLVLIQLALARREDKYKKLIAITVFLTFDLIVFGAFTRLTDSGLGCPDWPGCYGESNPFLAHDAIHAAHSEMPTGPVSFSKAWIEMIHRYLAMTVGILIVVQMVMAWVKRTSIRQSPWMPSFLFFLVCVQGAFGAWTVTLKLQPVIVTIHLILGMALLACLIWSHQWEQGVPKVSLAKPRLLKWLASISLCVVFMQLALGAWVSTNYAALACLDFPLCQGAWIPEMDFEHGFTLWRQLGQKANGEYLSFSALVAIHWVHRNFAFLVVALVFSTAWSTRKISGLRQVSLGLFAVLGMQVMTGLATIFFSWPLLIAVLHNAGAALLVSLLCVLNFRVFYGSQEASPQVNKYAL